MPLICSSVIVTLVLYYVAIRGRTAQQQQQQRTVLRDKLIQQRDDVARRLNDLQVNVSSIIIIIGIIIDKQE